MEQWHCFECQEKMVEGDVVVTYLAMEGPIEGITCPRCSTAYLLEDTVEKLVQVEALFESK